MIVFTLIFLFILIELFNSIETFISPTSHDLDFLEKCFKRSDINNFDYTHTHVKKHKNGMLFLTPNKYIKGIPKITWNGEFLNNFCVDPNNRDRGLGTKLLESAIKESRDNNKDHIMLQVYADNKRAIHLYEKMGFKVYSKGETQSGRKIYVYWKKL